MKEKQTVIMATGDKALVYKSFGGSEVVSLTANMIRTVMKPRTATGKEPDDSDLFQFMMLCKSRKLNPWEGDAFLLGYDTQTGPKWTIITAHQSLLKRAQAAKNYDGMESGIIVEVDDHPVDREGDFRTDTEKLLGAWATVYLKDQAHPVKRRVKLSTFQKPTKVWREMPEGMIVKTAEADALRSAFPNACSGMYIKEEAGAIIEEKNVTTEVSVSKPKPLFSAVKQLEPPAEPPVSVVEMAPTAPVAGDLPPVVSAPVSTTDNVIKGQLEDITERSGEKNGKKWTKFGLVLNGQTFGTFDTKLAEEANELIRQTVILKWKQDGKYMTAVSIAPAGIEDTPTTESSTPKQQDDLPY